MSIVWVGTRSIIPAMSCLHISPSPRRDSREYYEEKMAKGKAAEERKVRAPQRYPNPTSAVPGGYWLVLFVICSAVPALAQQCPQISTTGEPTASEPQTLEGRLVYHDSIRQWFELKLDQPQCGKASIQLVRGLGAYWPSNWTSLAVLRGCRVRSTGAIDFSGTGYYSLETYQSVEEIEPVGPCARQAPLPDYSGAKPDKAVRAYRVEMHVDDPPGDRPIVFRVSSAGKALRPWQAYARYLLMGGLVLYGFCGEGFVVDKVFGTPQAKPSHFTESQDPDDMAAFDLVSAADSGKKVLQLGYTCVRGR
jgi:hypothetical protein